MSYNSKWGYRIHGHKNEKLQIFTQAKVESCWEAFLRPKTIWRGYECYDQLEKLWKCVFSDENIWKWSFQVPANPWPLLCLSLRNIAGSPRRSKFSWPVDFNFKLLSPLGFNNHQANPSKMTTFGPILFSRLVVSSDSSSAKAFSRSSNRSGNGSLKFYHVKKPLIRLDAKLTTAAVESSVLQLPDKLGCLLSNSVSRNVLEGQCLVPVKCHNHVVSFKAHKFAVPFPPPKNSSNRKYNGETVLRLHNSRLPKSSKYLRCERKPPKSVLRRCLGVHTSTQKVFGRLGYVIPLQNGLVVTNSTHLKKMLKSNWVKIFPQF